MEGIMARIVLAAFMVLVAFAGGFITASKMRTVAQTLVQLAGCINGRCS